MAPNHLLCIYYVCFYTTTFLPFGKFYNRLGGNVGMLLAYLYVFAYLGLPSLKKRYYAIRRSLLVLDFTSVLVKHRTLKN